MAEIGAQNLYETAIAGVVAYGLEQNIKTAGSVAVAELAAGLVPKTFYQKNLNGNSGRIVDGMLVGLGTVIIKSLIAKSGSFDVKDFVIGAASSFSADIIGDSIRYAKNN